MEEGDNGEGLLLGKGELTFSSLQGNVGSKSSAIVL